MFQLSLPFNYTVMGRGRGGGGTEVPILATEIRNTDE
jgi:hypothetical protein